MAVSRMLCRFMASALVAGAVAGGALFISSPAEAMPAATPVPPVSTTAALPDWARVYTLAGHREVWLQPILGPGEEAWDARALLDDANAALRWFAGMSRQQFSVSATRVLEPIRFDVAATGSACNEMVRTWAGVHHAFAVQHLTDVHLVGLTRVRDCPYAGVGETPGQAIVITMMPTAPDIPEGTLIHELGHNLGLPHAAGYGGGQLSFSARPPAGQGPLQEYGDTTDIMGRADPAMPFGAATLAAIGWGEGVYVVPSVDGTYGIDLPPLTAVGPDGLVVDDPVSGVRYLLSFRKPVADAPSLLPSADRGIYLYEVRRQSPAPDIYGRESFTALMPWDASGIGAGAGTQWVSPTGAISFMIDTLTRASAHVTVGVSGHGGLADTAGPSWPVPPKVTITARGDRARLELPPAWDQSGVAGYRLTVGTGPDRVLLRPHIPSNVFGRDLITVKVTPRTRSIALAATDGLGHTSTWVHRLR